MLCSLLVARSVRAKERTFCFQYIFTNVEYFFQYDFHTYGLILRHPYLPTKIWNISAVSSAFLKINLNSGQIQGQFPIFPGA